MRSARRASPPRRPDPPAIPRSTLQHPTCGRLQKPPVGSQSFAHSFADLSLPPITSRATPHLGSKITIVRTASLRKDRVDKGADIGFLRCARPSDVQHNHAMFLEKHVELCCRFID